MKLKTSNHIVLLYITIAFIFPLSGISIAQNIGYSSFNMYYVGPNGNDSNPGTSAAPFQTIQHAANIVNPGDIVIVKDGVYTTPSTVEVVLLKRSGTSSAWITFKAENKWGAKITGSNSNVVSMGFFITSNVSYVKIQDFDIFGFTATGNTNNTGISIVNSASVSTAPMAPSNIELSGNNIHDIGRMCSDSPYGFAGIFVGVNSSSIHINKNMIHDIGRFSAGENGCNPQTHAYENNDHGIYVDGVSGITITDNVIYNTNHGWGIQFWGNYQATTNALVANNTFAFPNPYRNGQILLAAPGVINSTIENNIFYSPTTAGVLVNASLSSPAIVNNTPTGTAITPVFLNVIVNNNMVYGGGIISTLSAPGVTLIPSEVSITNNLENTDPDFVNANRYDFHLQSSSPAINAGITLPKMANDFDGNSRPTTTRYTIGAYEYVSGSGFSMRTAHQVK